MDYLEHHIVDHCNLKCAGCSHFSCLAEPWFEDIQDFTRDFDVLAQKTNQNVGCIRLMGGEPLLHPNYKEFLIIARQLFPYSNIQIVTNGILLPKYHDELVSICNNNNIQICISNYGLNINLNELLKDFKYKRIDDKNHLYNISFNLQGCFDIIDSFNNCDLHINHWYYFQYGRFYPCCIAANLHYFEQYFNIEMCDWDLEEVSISMHNNSILEIEQFLNKSIPLCKFCDTRSRPHTYKPFSVTKGDIKEWTCP